MARSIHTAENIIEAGEKLKSADGGTVEAWEVFKSLGSRGKFDRVREIWDGHVAAKSAAPASGEADLPDDIECGIETAMKSFVADIRRPLAAHLLQLTADHVRQLQLLQKQHSTDMSKQRSETEYWRELALELQQSDGNGDQEKETVKKPVAGARATRKAPKPRAKSSPVATQTSRSDKTPASAKAEQEPTATDDGQANLHL